MNAFFVWLGCSGLSAPPSGETMNPTSVYEGQQVTIQFPEDGFEVRPNVRQTSENTRYWEREIVNIEFCREPETEPYVQSVSSASGWLCGAYVLPPLSKEEVRKQIPRSDPKVVRLVEPREERISGNQVLIWKEQMGKTRLWHYLVFGEKANVLVVSSPYGDEQTPRKVAETLRFK